MSQSPKALFYQFLKHHPSKFIKMILADNLSSYMTHIVNPVEGQNILKAGDRTAVLFIDLIFDVSMYMEYCIDQEAKDTIRDLMETKIC